MSKRPYMPMRRAAVVIFTVLTALLGAMLVPTVVWMFSFGLLPSWTLNVLGLAAGAFTGYWGYQHTVYKDWLYPD